MPRIFEQPTLTDVNVSRISSGIINSVQSNGDGATARRMAEILTGGLSFWFYRYNLRPIPPIAIGVAQSGTYIWSAGVQGTELGTVIQRAMTETVISPFGVVLPTAWDGGRALLRRLDKIGSPIKSPYFLFGHSLGGAVLQVLALLLKAREPAALINIYTMGAPKPGGAQLAQNLLRFYIRAWANDDDPTPLVPPDARLFGSLGRAVPRAWADRSITYAVSAPCGVLDQRGVLKSVRAPDRVLPLAVQETILRSQDPNVEPFRAHSIQEYQIRLGLLQASFPRRGQPAPVVPAAAAQQVVDPRPGARQPPLQQPNIKTPAPTEEQARENALLAKMFDAMLAANFTSPLPEVFMTNMVIPREYLPFISKLSPELYSVTWMNQVVSYFASKSEAKVFSKKLVALLRYTSRSGPFEPVDWASAWSSWIDQAQQANNGFIPPLVVP